MNTESNQESVTSKENNVVKIAKPHILRVNDLDLKQRHTLEFFVHAPKGVSIDQLMHKETWQHIASNLKPLSEITVIAEDSKYYAKLLVVACGPLEAVTEVIYYKELGCGEVITDDNSPYEVKYVSNRYKWGIQRKSDKAWIEKDIPTAEEAYKRMSNEMSILRQG